MAIYTCQTHGEIEVLPGIYYSVQKKHIKAVVRQADVQFKVFDSHVGWGPGQLEQWLDTKAWRTVPATLEQVFDSGAGLWEEIR